MKKLLILFVIGTIGCGSPAKNDVFQMPGAYKMLSQVFNDGHKDLPGKILTNLKFIRPIT